ncbi:unnamed protein product [Larinioides sclopetarius]|uniref:Uncharacterized protein n=1 Tax=Larinioides sclopetarius TaxID=280406 RepID=A0AAV2BEK0_9ARAC
MSDSLFTDLIRKPALYENKITDLRFGAHQIRMLKEHAATCHRFLGTTYYQHYYNSCIDVRSSPFQPAIDSSKELIFTTHPGLDKAREFLRRGIETISSRKT